MTLEQYAYLGEIIAAIAVIASLVYIGRELRQNTDALAAQARYNLITQRSGLANMVIQDRDFADVLHRYTSNGEVTPAERIATKTFAVRQLETWEWQYQEYRAGMLPGDQLPLAAWRLYFHGRGQVPLPLEEAWEERKSVLTPDFAKFFEDNVINS